MPFYITHFLAFLGLLGLTTAAQAAKPIRVASPDGAVQVAVGVTSQGQPTCVVRYRSAEALQPSRLGLQLAGTDLSQEVQRITAENATDAPKTVQLYLSKPGLSQGTLITDGATNRSFSTRPVWGTTLSVRLPARGGFVVES